MTAESVFVTPRTGARTAVAGSTVTRTPVTAPVAPERKEAPHAPDPVEWRLVDLERYEVRWNGIVVGFIDVVGSVFVSLCGCRYDQAVEVKQSLVFDDAVSVLVGAVPGSPAAA